MKRKELRRGGGETPKSTKRAGACGGKINGRLVETRPDGGGLMDGMGRGRNQSRSHRRTSEGNKRKAEQSRVEQSKTAA